MVVAVGSRSSCAMAYRVRQQSRFSSRRLHSIVTYPPDKPWVRAPVQMNGVMQTAYATALAVTIIRRRCVRFLCQNSAVAIAINRMSAMSGCGSARVKMPRPPQATRPAKKRKGLIFRMCMKAEADNANAARPSRFQVMKSAPTRSQPKPQNIEEGAPRPTGGAVVACADILPMRRYVHPPTNAPRVARATDRHCLFSSHASPAFSPTRTTHEIGMIHSKPAGGDRGVET